MSINVVKARQFQNKHPPRGAEEHIFQEHPHSSGITLLIMFFMPGYVLGSRLNRHPHWCLYLSVGGFLIAILYPKMLKLNSVTLV